MNCAHTKVHGFPRTKRRCHLERGRAPARTHGRGKLESKDLGFAFLMSGYLLRFFLFIFLSAAGVADEGNWLFNAPPVAQIKAKYGFALTPEWLDPIRLPAVRFANGGAAALLFSYGFTMTYHHL